MDELEKQVQEELRAITYVLENLLGRRSRWNGDVELMDEPAAFGKARWSGGLILNRWLAESQLRWRTEIHELLHTFSVGLTVSDYYRLPGWEEGVVEGLQRLLRPAILTQLSVDVSGVVFAPVEANHEYNRYIAALENLLVALDQSAQPFYLESLATPLKDRPTAIFELGRQLPPDRFRSFQREFALTFSVLRGE